MTNKLFCYKSLILPILALSLVACGGDAIEITEDNAENLAAELLFDLRAVSVSPWQANSVAPRKVPATKLSDCSSAGRVTSLVPEGVFEGSYTPKLGDKFEFINEQCLDGSRSSHGRLVRVYRDFSDPSVVKNHVEGVMPSTPYSLTFNHKFKDGFRNFEIFGNIFVDVSLEGDQHLHLENNGDAINSLSLSTSDFRTGVQVLALDTSEVLTDRIFAFYMTSTDIKVTGFDTISVDIEGAYDFNADGSGIQFETLEPLQLASSSTQGFRYFLGGASIQVKGANNSSMLITIGDDAESVSLALKSADGEVFETITTSITAFETAMGNN